MPPKVSILMLTYNQEKYIGQALESILSQQVDFPYQIVIGEDCSTDRTREICQAFQKNYPDKINLLERRENLGMAGNFFSTLKECNGQYLAILEGDDFWINPLKLQKQSDFLDANNDFALVFTRTEAFFQDEGRPSYEIPPPDAEPYTLEGLLRINFIATCSVMYRWGLVNEFPNWYRKLEMLDWPMHILHAQRGKIGFIDELMAKYRIHTESNYSSRKAILNFKGMLMFYDIINRYLGYQYFELCYRQQSWMCSEVANLHLAEGQRLKWFQYEISALYYRFLLHLPASMIMYFWAD